MPRVLTVKRTPQPAKQTMPYFAESALLRLDILHELIAHTARPPSNPTGSAAAGVAGGGGGTPSPLDILRHDPQFIQIRADVQQNPQSLHEVLTLLQQTQPGLMEIITQNQEEFVRFLQELPALWTLPRHLRCPSQQTLGGVPYEKKLLAFIVVPFLRSMLC